MSENFVVLLAVFLCLVNTSTCEKSSQTYCYNRTADRDSRRQPSDVPRFETKQGIPIKSIVIRCPLKKSTCPKFHVDIDWFAEVDNTSLAMIYFAVECHSPMEVHFDNSRNIAYNNILLFLELHGECTVSMQSLFVLAKATDFKGIEFGRMHDSVNRSVLNKSASTEPKLITPKEMFAEIAYFRISSPFDTYNIAGMLNNTQNVFPSLAELRVQWKLEEIPTDQWRVTMPKLQYLDLSHSNLTKPPKFPWNNSTLEISRDWRRGRRDENVHVAQNIHIRGLDLTGNKIEDLSSHEFRGLLHELVLRGNGLTNVGPSCFHRLKGIKSIDLSINSLTYLPGNLFQGLSSLLNIDLGHNNISIIKKTLFHGLVNVRRIYLNDNRISNISDGLFETMSNLKILRLESNKIKQLRKSAFSAYPMLRQLHLQDNHLSSFPFWILRLTKIKELNLSRNRLTFLDLGKLLSVLRYFRNQRATKSERAKAKMHINLTKNKITTVDMTTQDFSTSEFADSAFWANLLLKFEITLTGNPLNCNCNMFTTVNQIQKRLRSNYAAEIKSLFSTWLCNWPQKRKGKSILNIRKKQWIHWKEPDNCPTKCSCQKRCSDGIIAINCGSASMTEVPSSMPQGRIELDLSDNEIKDIPAYDYLINVTVLKLTKNKVRQLNASVVQKLEHVKTLLVDSNQLKSLPREITTLNFKKIALDHNYFECSCETEWMKDWLVNNTGRIQDYQKVLCKSGQPNLLDKEMYSLKDNKFTCPTPTPSSNSTATPHPSSTAMPYPSVAVSQSPTPHLTKVAFVLCGLLLMIVIALIFQYKYHGEVKVFMFTRFNWHPFDRIDDSDPNKIYDAFISYSGEDHQWVVNTLQKQLENHIPPYKLCLNHRDFEIGALITENVFKSVDQSKRTLMVLSSSFTKSEWCLFEFRVAHRKVLKDRMNYLIIILFDDVDVAELDEEIKLYMRTNTYVRVSDEWFWQKLFYAMPQCSAKKSRKERITNV